MTANDTINGRTPEEIKEWLECCQYDSEKNRDCDACPYHPADDCYCYENEALIDTLAYIQQLERERDAAVEDIPRVCFLCKHVFDAINGEGNGECMTCAQRNKWQWRGVEVQHGTE